MWRVWFDSSQPAPAAVASPISRAPRQSNQPSASPTAIAAAGAARKAASAIQRRCRSVGTASMELARSPVGVVSAASVMPPSLVPRGDARKRIILPGGHDRPVMLALRLPFRPG